MEMPISFRLSQAPSAITIALTLALHWSHPSHAQTQDLPSLPVGAPIDVSETLPYDPSAIEPAMPLMPETRATVPHASQPTEFTVSSWGGLIVKVHVSLETGAEEDLDWPQELPPAAAKGISDLRDFDLSVDTETNVLLARSSSQSGITLSRRYRQVDARMLSIDIDITNDSPTRVSLPDIPVGVAILPRKHFSDSPLGSLGFHIVPADSGKKRTHLRSELLRLFRAFEAQAKEVPPAVTTLYTSYQNASVVLDNGDLSAAFLMPDSDSTISVTATRNTQRDSLVLDSLLVQVWIPGCALGPHEALASNYKIYVGPSRECPVATFSKIELLVAGLSALSFTYLLLVPLAAVVAGIVVATVGRRGRRRRRLFLLLMLLLPLVYGVTDTLAHWLLNRFGLSDILLGVFPIRPSTVVRCTIAIVASLVFALWIVRSSTRNDVQRDTT